MPQAVSGGRSGADLAGPGRGTAARPAAAAALKSRISPARNGRPLKLADRAIAGRAPFRCRRFTGQNSSPPAFGAVARPDWSVTAGPSDSARAEHRPACVCQVHPEHCGAPAAVLPALILAGLSAKPVMRPPDPPAREIGGQLVQLRVCGIAHGISRYAPDGGFARQARHQAVRCVAMMTYWDRRT